MSNKISLLIIIILSSIPALIGPILNIGQWSGDHSPYLSQILMGVTSMIIGSEIGYKFIFLIGTKKGVKPNSSIVRKSFIISSFTFIACLASWIISQEILLVFQKAIGMIEASKNG